VAFTISEDPDQQAVLADDSPRLLVTSPPGSGKTFTAVQLIARDIEAGRIGPTQRVLVLTFSRNARAQLERYADLLLTREQRRLAEITNYHRFFWSKVWQYRSALGLPLELEVATDAQHRQDVLAAMAHAGLGAPKRGDRNAFDDYARALEFGLDVGRPERLPEARPANDEVGRRLADVHRSGRLHFDDMAYYMWRLLESERLRALWAHKYPVIVLDEYQDAAPLQAAIIDRIAPPPHRVYAFADPLQLIYEFRDASPRRVEDFAQAGASEHTLRTLHRYKHQPQLQAWMQQARDVLLGTRERVTAQLPPEIEVVRYDPTLPGRVPVRGTPIRELFQLDNALSAAFRRGDVRSIGVLLRRRDQMGVVEHHLTKRFHVRHLKAADSTADWLRDWLDDYPSAITTEHHARRLLEVALRVVPRREDLPDLQGRVGVDGVSVRNLREPKRALADEINRLAAGCNTLTGSFTAAQAVARLACRGQSNRLISWDALQVVRQTLVARADLTNAEARTKAADRLMQQRMVSAGHERRGVSLLTCHEGKGQEFDMIVIPYLSGDSFEDDQQARQLLYVSLSRARRRLFLRVPTTGAPELAHRLGLI
jgi:DNA helicase-2/ATP-dependent DNA helicase PcrA